MSNSIKDLLSHIADSPRPTLGEDTSAAGGVAGVGTSGGTRGMLDAFGGTYDDDVKEASSSKVLFKLDALVYKVVKISPELCLGYLKGNLSFCRKAHDDCGAKHGVQRRIHQVCSRSVSLGQVTNYCIRSPSSGDRSLGIRSFETHLVQPGSF